MNIKETVDNQRAYFKTHETLDIDFRLDVLKKIRKLLVKYTDQFKEAFKLDYNKCEFEFLSTEMMMVLEEADYMIKNLKKLSKVKKVRTSIVNFPSKGYIVPEPYGVVLIMAPWNYPLQLSLAPLFGALASGNTVVLKPASYTKNVSNVIFALFNELNMPNLVSVVLGGRNENQALLDQRFDYIFFTGGQNVGRLVLEKASVYLTPVSLELGGKSPCIVYKDADVKLAAKRITWGKFLNAGQTCVAPDYICVHRSVHDKFVDEVKANILKYYYDEQDIIRDDYPYLINEKHLQKVLSLINKDKVIVGGGIHGQCFEPTVLDNVSFDDACMQEEIFGPIMPIIIYDDLDDLLRMISSHEKPLAFYLFSQSKKVAKRVFNLSSFGGGCVNDVIMHLTNDNLPFGGVGYSGMGSYHGKKSFDTFTHYKSVLVKPKLEINVKYPPYNKSKVKFIKKIGKIK